MDSSATSSNAAQEALLQAANRTSFCIAPFTQLHIATDGRVAPCCEYAGSVGSVHESGIADLWTGTAMADIRAKFLAEQPLKGCWKCFDRESGECASQRHLLNEELSHHIPENIAEWPFPINLPPTPIKFDVRFSNVCNFRCRTCWHGSSSKWFADARSLGWTAGPKAEIRSFRDLPEALDQLAPALPALEELYFAGGEPLVTNEHYALVNALLERGLTGVHLRYNTNLSTLEHRAESVLELWKNFPGVWVGASIDAAGREGELIRKDFNWETFVRNVLAIRERTPHVTLQYHVTVSALNVFYLTDLFDAVMERCGASPWQFVLHSLQEPPFYSTRILTPRMKRRLRKQFKSYGRKLSARGHAGAASLARRLDSIAEHMMEKDEGRYLPEFRRVVSAVDRIRGEHSARTLARLASLLMEPQTLVERALAWGRRLSSPLS